MTTPTITGLAATDLNNALHNAALFAHKDGNLPALNGVHLIVRNGKLLVEATDRYRIIEIDVVAGEEPGTKNDYTLEHANDLSIVIRLHDLKNLQSWLKLSGKHSILTLTLERRKDFHSSGMLRITNTAQDVLTIPYTDDSFTPFPKLGALLDEIKPVENPAPTLAVNPRYLSDIGRIQDQRLPRSIRTSFPTLIHFPAEAKRPLHFVVGDWARGLLMTIRTPETTLPAKERTE